MRRSDHHARGPAVPAGGLGLIHGLHMLTDPHVMALGTSQRSHFYGLTLAVVGVVVMCAATLFIARRLSRAA